MWHRPDVDDDAQARSLCQDLANGKSIQPNIDGTLRKSPQLSRSKAL
jgi:hypothetical protein